MRILVSSCYAAVMALISVMVFAAGAGAASMPQVMANGGHPLASNAQTTKHSNPRAAHQIKSAAKPRPAQDGSSQILSATSTTPHLETIITADAPTLYLQSFDKLPVGSNSPVQTDTLTNTSTDTTVNFDGISVDDPTDYLVDSSNCGDSLAPGQSCTITITYAPASECAGGFQILTINDDDPGGAIEIGLTAGTFQTGGLGTTALTDTSAASATTLAQAIAGTGITISNATFTGAPNAAGTFTGGNGILGFGNGIALSNGSIVNVIGPNCNTGITGVNNQPGDTDLTGIIAQPTLDASVLNFDFVPTSALVTFQYVFASDEYQDFVFDFNDVFAFFVNGQNIALVPQTNSIVSINNINNGSTEEGLTNIPPVNPQFYVNNDVQFPDVSPFNTEMDGMTVVLTATARVNPGVTNHIKLAIADALDQEVDSNVFILAGSLTSTNVLLSPSTLAFGNQSLGGTSAGQTFTLTNLGTTALNTLAISTQESGNFSETNTCGTSVAAGASCTITVKFNPQGQAGGVIQENLQISDSAPDSPQRVALSGTAISGPFATFSPASLTFPPGTPGTGSAPQTIMVTNTGAATLTITSIVSTDDSFSETDNCTDGAAIPPNGTCTINVVYDPAQAGTPESGLLIVTDNAQNNGSQSINLTGNVTTGITITPSNLAFGNQAVNTTSAPQIVTFTNIGSANVTIPSILVGTGFNETNNCTSPAGIAPDASCAVTVTFTPGTATTFSTNLTFTDNGPNSPQQVALTGTGTSASNELLTITEAGTGTGTVTSAPAGINCQPTCTANFASGTVVTLTATPAAGSTFTGWSGANSCEGTGTCTFTITAATSVTATFGGGTTTFALTVTEAGTGTGTVTSAPAGISCKPTCSANFASGTQITLTAAPAAGSTFTGWSGANSCEGTGTCTFTITAATAVTATFGGGTTNFALTVNEAGSGTGTVTSTPTGINCKPTCSANFASGTAVTLTAAPAEGSTFTGWSAPCEGTGTCTVTITAATAVTATFSSPSGVIVTVPAGGSTNATTTPGGTAFFGLQISGGTGVTGTVQLGCSSASPFITCTVIPSTITLNGGTTTVAFGIQTFCTGATTAAGFVPGGFGGGMVMMLMAMMLGSLGAIFGRNRRVAMTLAMFTIIAILGLGACSSLPKGPNGATPAGVYPITLTTTLNGQTQTLTNFLTLTVK
jgi:hypothetical protein